MVEAVDLVEVDIIGAEPLQAGIHLGQDRFAREARAVGAGPHAMIDLGGDHDFLAPDEVLQRPPDDFLAGPVRIHVGGVEEIDAEIERHADQRAALGLGQRPGMGAALRLAETHAAEAQAGHIKTGSAELHIVHGTPPQMARPNRS